MAGGAEARRAAEVHEPRASQQEDDAGAQHAEGEAPCQHSPRALLPAGAYPYQCQKAQQQAETDLAQATILHEETVKRQAELDKQRTDLSVISSQLTAKAEALTEYDAKLRHTEAELRIKVQQATVKE